MSRTARNPNRTFPQSAIVERELVGAILAGHPSAATVFAKLHPESFTSSIFRAVFSVAKRLHSQGKPFDIVAVSDAMSERDRSEIGGLQALAEITADALDRYDVHYACEILARRDRQRELIRLLERAEDGAWSDHADPDALAESLTEGLTALRAQSPAAESQFGSLSTAELFAAQENEIDWLAWPFAAVGLSSILDALPKLGKTRFLLEGIYASRYPRPFLNVRTQPMRVIYLSEQSAASLAMQAREVGFTGLEPVEELRWITREFWSRYVFTDFLEKLEKHFLEKGGYNALVCDTWHTIARLEDEKDASEVNRLGNLTIDVATRNKLALSLGRHDRKSGGDVGVSGRSSIQLSGLVDVILHLVRIPNQPTQRKLELLGRVPGLPNEQLIELSDGRYINYGQPQPAPAHVADRTALVAEWLDEEPNLTGEQIVSRFAAMVPVVEISSATAKRYRALAQQRNGGNKS